MDLNHLPDAATRTTPPRIVEGGRFPASVAGGARNARRPGSQKWGLQAPNQYEGECHQADATTISGWTGEGRGTVASSSSVHDSLLRPQGTRWANCRRSVVPLPFPRPITTLEPQDSPPSRASRGSEYRRRNQPRRDLPRRHKSPAAMHTPPHRAQPGGVSVLWRRF